MSEWPAVQEQPTYYEGACNDCKKIIDFWTQPGKMAEAEAIGISVMRGKIMLDIAERLEDYVFLQTTA